MAAYHDNIEDLTEQNTNFRQVLYTGKHAQLVVMDLKVGEEIGMEVHPAVDQFFRIESGKAKFVVDGEEFEVTDGFAVIVPAGAMHNVINTGEVNLKLYTLYCPPNHPEGTIHATKTDAAKAEQEEHKQ